MRENKTACTHKILRNTERAAAAVSARAANSRNRRTLVSIQCQKDVGRTIQLQDPGSHLNCEPRGTLGPHDVTATLMPSHNWQSQPRITKTQLFSSAQTLSQHLVCSSPLASSSFEPQRHLVRNPYSVAFQCHNLLRMIGQHPDIFQPQVDQDLCPDAAFMLHHA